MLLVASDQTALCLLEFEHGDLVWSDELGRDLWNLRDERDLRPNSQKRDSSTSSRTSTIL